MMRAIARRNWVLDRMAEEGYVTVDDAEAAKLKPLVTIQRRGEFVDDAEYFSEEVRRQSKTSLAKMPCMKGGLLIRTTLNPKLQKIASKAFREEIKNYDQAATAGADRLPTFRWCRL